MRLFRVVVVQALVLVLLSLLFSHGVSDQYEQQPKAINKKSITKEERQQKLEQMFQKAKSLPAGNAHRIRILENIHKLEPTHVLTRILLALDLVATKDSTARALKLLEECFDPSVVGANNALAELNRDEHSEDDDDAMATVLLIPKIVSPQAFSLANYLGRYFYEVANYKKSLLFAKLALNISSRLSSSFPENSMEGHEQQQPGDVCTALQLATMLDTFPSSVQAADQALTERQAAARAFWKRKPHQKVMNPNSTSCAMLMGAADDPYTHCIMSLFHLSFYYRADVKRVANQHFRMTAAAWPDLLYVAPHVQKYENQVQEQQMQRSVCKRRKIKLGIISGAMTEGHPVTEDFSGVLQRLDRSIFNVTYVLVEAGKYSGMGIASFTKVHPDMDQTYIYGKDGEKDECNAAALVRRLGNKIENLEFDMILYLDLTMSGEVRRLGMQRLAPVQLNTHGHPVTSGHNRSIIQYFVSWQEAELPTAKDHYTEELVLIPKGKIHQYYEPRILHVGPKGQRVSRIDKFPFWHLTRRDFDLPNNGTIYLCMQKPFKLHPEFDHLVCGILRNHPTGHVVLHRTDHQHTHDLFVERLQRAGCGTDDSLERVHFVPQQPHHRLLALYELATVILDSYPAGGCTTTREVLELGKALVTLPAKLLGSRWTLGYYNVIDLAAHAREALVAESEQEYINLAVELGTNKTKRLIVEEAVREAAPRLFHRQEAVEEWQRILLEASPVHICKDERRDEL